MCQSNERPRLDFACSLRERTFLGDYAKRGYTDEANRLQHHPDVQTESRRHQADQGHAMDRPPGSRDRITQVRTINVINISIQDLIFGTYVGSCHCICNAVYSRLERVVTAIICVMVIATIVESLWGI